jgi:hypothetical protein
MTSDRTQAYGRVVRTLEDLGPAKLQPVEQERIREAADNLIFAADLDEAREALAPRRHRPLDGRARRAAGRRPARLRAGRAGRIDRRTDPLGGASLLAQRQPSRVGLHAAADRLEPHLHGRLDCAVRPSQRSRHLP